MAEIFPKFNNMLKTETEKTKANNSVTENGCF